MTISKCEVIYSHKPVLWHDDTTTFSLETNLSLDVEMNMLKVCNFKLTIFDRKFKSNHSEN